MRIASAHKPAPPRQTVVSAYLDGTATHIQSHVLDGVEQFEEAVAAEPSLRVIVDGDRRSNWGNYAMAAGILALPSLAAGAAALFGVGLPAKALKGLAFGGSLVALVPAYRALRQSFEGTAWKHQARYTIGGQNRPSPVPEAGAERLRSLLAESANTYPNARHIGYISGHGTRTEVANMNFGELQQKLADQKLDGLVLDACLTNQLEVLSKLAPWAGVVLASTHILPAQGLPISDMFAGEVLSQPDDKALFSQMAEKAAPAGFSFAAIDTEVVKQRLTPSLDRLGERLAAQLKEGDSAPVARALRDSSGPRWGYSGRADLGHFLKSLQGESLDPGLLAAAAEAQKALQEALLYSKDKNTLTFDYRDSHQDPSLGPGWREFLGAVKEELWYA